MGVVPALDELEHGHAGLGLGFEAAAGEQLALERGEEALAHRVVEAVADRTHRGPHALVFEFGVKPDPRRRWPL
jgi:hypothetical protein